MENSNENPKGTNKTVLYIIGAVIIIGAIIFFMNKGGVSNMTSNSSLGDSVQTMLASGASKQCTFSETTDSSQSTGNIYVASGKMRGDFTSVSNGVTTQAHMVMSNGYTYTWVDGMATGFKVVIPAQGQESTNTSGQPLNINDPKNINCTSWSADDTKFALPANVSFPDLPAATTNSSASAKTNTAAPAGTTGVSGSAAQCSYCNNLPTDQKNQCRAALNCQ